MSKFNELILKFISYKQAEQIRNWAYDAVRLSGMAQVLSQFRDSGAAVFTYHSIGGQGLFHDNVLSTEAFGRHLEFMSMRYKIIPLLEIVEAAKKGINLPRNCVALTFDDGYRDFVDNALPILRAYNAPSTFFIPTDILQQKPLFFDVLDTAIKQCDINDLTLEYDEKVIRLPLSTVKEREDATLRLALISRTMSPEDRKTFIQEIFSQTGEPDISMNSLYISGEELSGLGDDVEIGSHSCGHYNLARLSDEQLEFELVESRRVLEQTAGRKVRLLAYPFGKPWSYDQRVQDAVSNAGYLGATTTIPGLVGYNSTPYAIPRYGSTDNLSRYSLNCRGIHF